jgi:hypothetical protein
MTAVGATAIMARAPLSARSAHEETFSVQTRRYCRGGDINDIVGLPSPAVRAHAFLVRAKSPPRQDFENLAGTLETLVTLADIRLAIRRLART